MTQTSPFLFFNLDSVQPSRLPAGKEQIPGLLANAPVQAPFWAPPCQEALGPCQGTLQGCPPEGPFQSCHIFWYFCGGYCLQSRARPSGILGPPQGWETALADKPALAMVVEAASCHMLTD